MHYLYSDFKVMSGHSDNQTPEENGLHYVSIISGILNFETK
jgi:hypothetical protein